MVLKDLVQTPNTQWGHVPNNPVLDGALISDDDDSFISDDESDGGKTLWSNQC